MNALANSVENVVVLVGDAVRWDATQRRLAAEYGRTYKTVAASLHTPTAFATMFSGRHPPTHAVSGFRRSVSLDTDTLLDLDSHETAFSTGGANEWICERQELFGTVYRTTLEEADPPFVWINRHPGGHAPYGNFGADGDGQSVGEYFDQHAQSDDRLESDYQEAIDEFVADVDETLELLSRRGIRNETLVVVTSDHGELLGEGGHVGHNFPARPELVYVPTTFVHPEIDPERVSDGVARHVDLYPTLLDALGSELPRNLPGQSLFARGPATAGVNFYDRSVADFARIGLTEFPGRDRLLSGLPERGLTLRSAWTEDGGHCFNDTGTLLNLLVWLIAVFASPEGNYIRKQRMFARAYRSMTASHRVHGSPDITEETARELITEATQSTAGDRGDAATQMNEDTRERLQEMGYL